MANPSKTRPLANVPEEQLRATIAVLLAKPKLTRCEYGELLDINWELRFRELLMPKPLIIPKLGTGGDHVN